ncbi:MAG TPA: GNAT family N-acetyltransferase [Caldilineaceae bacterium]|nr:GNAT family N-acetyltransferase [Caldilineaceae bacterium]
MSEVRSLPTVTTYPGAGDFLARMMPLLLQEEVKYGLMLGVAQAVRETPHLYGEHDPYFAIATDITTDGTGESGIAAAAAMTPPYALILYSERADPRPGLQAIAQNLLDGGWPISGVNSWEPLSRLFAEIWSELAGVDAAVAVHERVFELRQVIHPTYSPGRLRPAVLGDLALVTQWFEEFTREALQAVETLTPDEARRRAERRIQQGAVYLWEDGEPVSLAGVTRPTANGITIGPVYTPPNRRGRGYASSLVAQLSQRLLDEGRSFVTLFTDLANPTSNRIYQNIGYRPVCDYTVFRFERRAS